MIYAFDMEKVLADLEKDPAGAIAGWEAGYRDQIQKVADFIDKNRHKSPIVLLSGPSGSSKTSTATRIQKRLVEMGITAHLLSMDNYFIGLDDENYPRLDNGRPNLESPDCLDMALLDDHFSKLEAGQDIYVPEYDFHNQRRVEGAGTFMDIEPGDVFIFEGIHALNRRFTDRHPDACRIYVSPEAVYQQDGNVICTTVQLRLIRRLVRDYLFRGAEAAYTLGLWDNVLVGEDQNIAPFQTTAHCQVVTAMPYELGVLKKFVLPLIRDLGPDVPRADQVEAIRVMMGEIPMLSAALVPDDSIVREFIGPRPENKEQ